MKKKILMLATGGTIAGVQTPRGICALRSGEELLEKVPGIQTFCDVSVEEFAHMDSSDMTPDTQFTLAKTVYDRYEEYDGFVITHGTDTMAYTSAFLSHCLSNVEKPVLLTGSMRPFGFEDSDAEINLTHAFLAASSEYWGVAVVEDCRIIDGRRAKKLYSDRYPAFASCGKEPAGRIEDGRVWFRAKEKTGRPLVLRRNVSGRTGYVKLAPGMDVSFLTWAKPYDNIILESYGAGGLPAAVEPVVLSLLRQGKHVYITTQCPFGGVDLRIYEVGRRALAAGAVSLSGMTAEDAYAAVLFGDV